MDFLALGALFFLVVVAFSVGLEIQDRYQEGSDGLRGFRLLPRRNYYDLHDDAYGFSLPPPEASTDASGTFLVKREDRPSRCEVCHQVDMYHLESGHCQRCNHTTI